MVPAVRRKVAVIYSHPIQYAAPLLRALAGETDLQCFFCSEGTGGQGSGYGVDIKWDLPLTEGYPHRTLRNIGQELGLMGFFANFNPGIVPALWHGRYDAVMISGYYSATAILGMLAARARGTKVLLRGDSNEDKARAPWKRLLKAAILRTIFRLVDGFLVVGRKNQQYYERYGVAARRCHSMIFSVENARFAAQARALAPERAALRRAFSLEDGETAFVFAGRFAEDKGLAPFLEAFARVAAHARVKLVLVGDGALKGALEAQATRLGCRDRVLFAGFLNQTEIGRAYAACDVLILPSAFEPWGLVANEAMNFDLPCVASDRVGCAHDLVVDGVNGLVVPFGDLAGWERALTRFATDAAFLAEQRAGAARVIGQWTIARTVAGFLAALDQLAGPRASSSR